MDLLDMIALEIWRQIKEWIIKQWKSKCWVQIVVLISMIFSLGVGLLVINQSE